MADSRRPSPVARRPSPDAGCRVPDPRPLRAERIAHCALRIAHCALRRRPGAPGRGAFRPWLRALPKRTLGRGSTREETMKYQIERGQDGHWVMRGVWKRGAAVLSDPLLNKGTAFSREERELFALEGLLPTEITDRDTQVRRAFA